MEEGTGEGTGTGAGTGQNEGLWREQLPADLKANEVFTPYKTLGDFAKMHLETAGKTKELEGKLSGAIFKPDDNAKPEDRESFYRSLGKPEKATEYEFPKTEGIEHDPKMIEWAQATFHSANLSKEQAASIGAAWDGFISGMVKAQQESAQKAIADVETKLKAELGDQYDTAKELTRRLLTKHAKPDELAFMEEGGLGNHPALIRLMFEMAKKTGEDVSPKGAGYKGETAKVGMNYKSMSDFRK